MKSFCCYTFLLLSVYLPAQQLLTLDSAIAILLKNNYTILLAKNSYHIAANNYAPGVAGMLPSVSIGATLSGSDNTINQHYSSGLEFNRSGAISTTISPSAGLNWTLFDGAKMFVAYNLLGLFRDEGQLSLKSSVENNVASIIEAYYNIVQQKQLLAVLDSNLALYAEEMDIAKKQYEIGNGSKLNYLQAEVSYNAQNSALLKQQVTLSNSIISLNQLLELPVETTYNVREDIDLGNELVYENLKNILPAQNSDLLFYKTEIKVAEDSVKVTNAYRLPELGLGLNYGLSRTQSNAGFALLNQSTGISGGLTLSWTLFNGSVINIEHENARIGEENAQFRYNMTNLTLSASLLENYKQYQINLKILGMDEENFMVAKENVFIALAQFRIGTANIVQLQQAQASYAAAGSQVVSDRYSTKVSETQLLQLTGQLVK